MKTFLSQTTLARRLNIPNATLVLRLRTNGVQMDAVVMNGNKANPVFDSERLPELRRVLTPQQNEMTTK